MAGEYIFFEVGLCQQRKVVAIGRRCGWNGFEAAGRLADFWGWLTGQAVEEIDRGKTGVLVDIDVDALVDAGVAPVELLEAMIAEEWLAVRDHDGRPSLIIPDWDSWLSRSAKARRNKAIRQRHWRASQSSVDGAVDGAVDAPVDGPEGASKRREERGKKKEGKGKKSEGKGSAASAAVDLVFAHYKTFHPKSKPGDKERKLVLARWQEGYSAEDLCSAINGCHKTPHNLGANDRNTEYLGLTVIMKDSSQVARFIEADENPPQARSEKEQRTLDAARCWLEGSPHDEG